jgi:hypothetical protein
MKSALREGKDLWALSTRFFTRTHGSSTILRTELILAAIQMDSKLFLGMSPVCEFLYINCSFHVRGEYANISLAGTLSQVWEPLITPRC